MADKNTAAETKTTVHYAIAANLTIALVKGVTAVITGSTALFAETAHSLADTGNQTLLRISLSRAKKPPDEDHPFGYERERFFWALLVAVFMFVAGALFSVADGVLAFFFGGSLSSFALAYAVLAFSLVAEGISLTRALREVHAGARRAGWSMAGYIRVTTDPTVLTVVFEDAAGVAGVLVATAGVAAHQLTGSRAWEGVASIAIGCGLAFVAASLGRMSKDLIIGQPALPAERDALRNAVLAHPDVEEIVDLKTIHLGPRSLFVALRLAFAEGTDADEITATTASIETELVRAVPDVSEIFVDSTGRETDRPRATTEAGVPNSSRLPRAATV